MAPRRPRHVIRDGMTTYPGLPGPQITPHLTRNASRASYAPGTEFAIDRISMVGNTGTYLDSPYHRYPDGTDLAGLPCPLSPTCPPSSSAPPGPDCAPLTSAPWPPTTSRPRRAPAYRRRHPLGHPRVRPQRAVPHLSRRPLARRPRSAPRRHRRRQHRLDGRRGGRSQTRPHSPACRRHPRGRAPHQSRAAAPHGGRFTAVPPRIARFGTFPVRAYGTVPVQGA